MLIELLIADTILHIIINGIFKWYALHEILVHGSLHEILVRGSLRVPFIFMRSIGLFRTSYFLPYHHTTMHFNLKDKTFY